MLTCQPEQDEGTIKEEQRSFHFKKLHRRGRDFIKDFLKKSTAPVQAVDVQNILMEEIDAYDS